MQQFARLRVLSAADNLLPDISCLEVLTACPHLQVTAGATGSTHMHVHILAQPTDAAVGGVAVHSRSQTVRCTCLTRKLPQRYRARCLSLQVASFERNPLTGLPNYRQKVLQLLPNLENLDGQVGRAAMHSMAHWPST